MGLYVFTVYPIPSWWLREYIALSYYHHQIGSVNYYPLFRVRSWNNGMRCMSLYSYAEFFSIWWRHHVVCSRQSSWIYYWVYMLVFESEFQQIFLFCNLGIWCENVSIYFDWTPSSSPRVNIMKWDYVELITFSRKPRINSCNKQ